MYNYMVDQLQNFKHRSKTQTVPDPFQGINLIFRQMIYEQDQRMYNYMVNQIQTFKLQMQAQEVPVYDLSLSEVTSQNFLSQMI